MNRSHIERAINQIGKPQPVILAAFLGTGFAASFLLMSVLLRPIAALFFFQAEDGIRDFHVTGVQTCALPIFDAIMMRLLDACLSIPRVLLLVALLALWSPVPLTVLILIIGLTGWFEVSRLVRAEVLSVMQREYVLAARALGAPGFRIVWRHVLPNVLNPVIVAATLGVGNVIILEAGLSYLGIGARAPTASWGSIFFDGSDAFQATWWIALFPGLAIIITVLAFNVLGTALRDALDPHQLAGGDAR